MVVYSLTCYTSTSFHHEAVDNDDDIVDNVVVVVIVNGVLFYDVTPVVNVYTLLYVSCHVILCMPFHVTCCR